MNKNIEGDFQICISVPLSQNDQCRNEKNFSVEDLLYVYLFIHTYTYIYIHMHIGK